MKLRKFAVIAAMGLCAAGSAWAKDYQAGQVEIDDLWVRASAPGQSMARATWRSTTRPRPPTACCRSVRAAERVELHTVETKDGVAKMRQVEGGIALPPAARSSWPRHITSCSSS